MTRAPPITPDTPTYQLPVTSEMPSLYPPTYIHPTFSHIGSQCFSYIASRSQISPTPSPLRDPSPSISESLSFVGELISVRQLLQINAEVSDPTVLMLKSDNKGLLERIVQDHGEKQDEESRKLEERASKILRYIDRVKRVRVQGFDSGGGKRKEKKTRFLEPIRIEEEESKGKYVERIEIQTFGNTPTNKAQNQTPKATQPNTTDKSPISLLPAPKPSSQLLPHFPPSTQSSPKRKTLHHSRVLDVHQILRTSSSHQSPRQQSFQRQSFEKLEKQISELSQQLEDIKYRQLQTEESIQEMKIEKIDERLESNMRTLRRSGVVAEGSARDSKVTKTVHIELKKATKIDVRNSKISAIIVEVSTPKEKSKSRSTVRNTVRSNESRIRFVGESAKKQGSSSKIFHIAKKKPLLTTRITRKES